MDKKEQTRLRVQRYRDKQKSVTSGGALQGSVTDRTGHLAEALIDPLKRSKLISISQALDKKTTGLDGKYVHLGSMIRYGINGFTLKEIGELV